MYVILGFVRSACASVTLSLSMNHMFVCCMEVTVDQFTITLTVMTFSKHFNRNSALCVKSENLCLLILSAPRSLPIIFCLKSSAETQTLSGWLLQYPTCGRTLQLIAVYHSMVLAIMLLHLLRVYVH